MNLQEQLAAQQDAETQEQPTAQEQPKAAKKGKFGRTFYADVTVNLFNANGDRIQVAADGTYNAKSQEEQDQLEYQCSIGNIQAVE